MFAHLSETRARSKTRQTTCQAEFLKHHVQRVSARDAAALSAQLALVRTNAHAAGSTHERAVMPARRGAPSILKGRGQSRVALGLPKRRLGRKMSINYIKARFPSDIPTGVSRHIKATMISCSPLPARNYASFRFSVPPKRGCVSLKMADASHGSMLSSMYCWA